MTSYWGKDFFEVFQGFGQTLLLFMQGKCGLNDLASDELQVLILGLIGVSCALVGTFLVLRKMTMLANSVSHTILIGIVIAFMLLRGFSHKPFTEMLHIDLGTLILASLISSLLTMFLTESLTHHLKLQKDASIGIVFSFLFAMGIILVTLFTRNTHIGVELIMGNVDMLHKDDLITALALALINIGLITLFYKEYLITSFDKEFATLLKISNSFFSYLLLIQTSATIVGAFRAVGVVLVLALLLLPVMTARLITSRLKVILFLAPILSLFASLIAVALSRHILTVYGFALSTGGLVATIQTLLWAVVFLIKKIQGASHRVRHKSQLYCS